MVSRPKQAVDSGWSANKTVVKPNIMLALQTGTGDDLFTACRFTRRDWKGILSWSANQAIHPATWLQGVSISPPLVVGPSIFAMGLKARATLHHYASDMDNLEGKKRSHYFTKTKYLVMEFSKRLKRRLPYEEILRVLDAYLTSKTSNFSFTESS